MITTPTPDTQPREEAVLLPCPFCGSPAEIERYGDGGRSTIYQCTSCSCSLETGEEWHHGRGWNKRILSAPAAGGVDAVAMAIVGPHLPVSAGSKWSLDELRKVRWDGLSEQERQQARNSAKAVLALSPAPTSGSEAGGELIDSRLDMAWADGAKAAMNALADFLPDAPAVREMDRIIAQRQADAIAGRQRATPAPSPAGGSEAGGEPVTPNEHGIMPCKCGSYPTPSGDGARPDDGYRTLWCQSCQKHVTEWHSSEEAAIRAWNEERELETGATSHYSATQVDEIATPAPSPAGGDVRLRIANIIYAEIGSRCTVDGDREVAGAEAASYAAADRILAVLSPATAARGDCAVKPLEWVDLSDCCIAHTPFGVYKVAQAGETVNMFIARSELAKSFHATIDEAKAAAQADYETRIRSALASPDAKSEDTP